MKRFLFPSIVSVFLILLSVWIVSYGFDHRRIYFGEYTYCTQDIKALSRFPVVLYELGERAWQEFDADKAARLFRQVVARDPLYMDAWIKLAEAEIEVGNEDLARKIAVFCNMKTSRVLRWKQSQTLLAHELGMQDIFRHNLNYLVYRKNRLFDIFYLLDTHTKFQTNRALELLSSGNWPAYLEWLISWNRTDAAKTVWEAIEESGGVTDELLKKYVHFLVSQKDVEPAAALWRQYTNICGMTNAGFEKETTQIGFDWRISNDKAGRRWRCHRVYGQSLKGAYSLRISFLGRENLNWDHIYQVVPVTPGVPYKLTYWWKSEMITTDQGPFVEIYSFDANGLHLKGPMALGSRDWTQVVMVFAPPVDCHAVVVQLRRNESLRFDNKIQGVLWVDDFALSLQKQESTIFPPST